MRKGNAIYSFLGFLVVLALIGTVIGAIWFFGAGGSSTGGQQVSERISGFYDSHFKSGSGTNQGNSEKSVIQSSTFDGSQFESGITQSGTTQAGNANSGSSAVSQASPEGQNLREIPAALRKSAPVETEVNAEKTAAEIRQLDTKEDIIQEVNGKGINREMALQDALRSAISAARGVYIQHYATTQMKELTWSQTNAATQGSVSDYRILSESGPDAQGLYQVQIQATVPVCSYLDSKGERVVLVQRMFHPSVMIDPQIEYKGPVMENVFAVDIAQRMLLAQIRKHLQNTMFHIYDKEFSSRKTDFVLKMFSRYTVSAPRQERGANSSYEAVGLDLYVDMTMLDNDSKESIWRDSGIHHRRNPVKLDALKNDPYGFLISRLEKEAAEYFSRYLQRELEWLNNGAPVEFLVSGADAEELFRLKNVVEGFWGVQSARLEMDGNAGRVIVVSYLNNASKLAEELIPLLRPLGMKAERIQRKHIYLQKI